MDDREPFLARWSRRKLEAKAQAPDAAPAVRPPAAGDDAPPASVTQPVMPESPQGVSTEYREFFDPKVDEKLRQTALRKLFSDPHYNVMDGLDTYVEDYAKADGIPEAMLRQLNQAKELFPLGDEKGTSEGADDAVLEAAADEPAAPQARAANISVEVEPKVAKAIAPNAEAGGFAPASETPSS